MSCRVTVVDYGMGNLLSVSRALEHCGADVIFESSPHSVAKAERLILPGVGAFGNGMAELLQRNLIDATISFAATGRPLLGICLGMQMLLDGSDEFGASAGLGLLSGWVRKLPCQLDMKLPNIGWSSIQPPSNRRWDNSLLENIVPGQEVYFVHSYHADLQNADQCLAQSQYGDFQFCSVLQKNNITGCQFHPEKSGEVGLNIIRGFLK